MVWSRLLLFAYSSRYGSSTSTTRHVRNMRVSHINRTRAPNAIAAKAQRERPINSGQVLGAIHVGVCWLQISMSSFSKKTTPMNVSMGEPMTVYKYVISSSVERESPSQRGRGRSLQLQP